jgi:hypothetical protein
VAELRPDQDDHPSNGDENAVPTRFGGCAHSGPTYGRPGEMPPSRQPFPSCATISSAARNPRTATRIDDAFLNCAQTRTCPADMSCLAHRSPGAHRATIGVRRGRRRPHPADPVADLGRGDRDGELSSRRQPARCAVDLVADGQASGAHAGDQRIEAVEVGGGVPVVCLTRLAGRSPTRPA